MYVKKGTVHQSTKMWLAVKIDLVHVSLLPCFVLLSHLNWNGRVNWKTYEKYWPQSVFFSKKSKLTQTQAHLPLILIQWGRQDRCLLFAWTVGSIRTALQCWCDVRLWLEAKSSTLPSPLRFMPLLSQDSRPLILDYHLLVKVCHCLLAALTTLEHRWTNL